MAVESWDTMKLDPKVPNKITDEVPDNITDEVQDSITDEVPAIVPTSLPNHPIDSSGSRLPHPWMVLRLFPRPPKQSILLPM